MHEGEISGTAFYRIDPHFRDFLSKCQEKHAIIGLEWDGESLNLGFVLAEQTPTPAEPISD